jgi:hypothetical protein
MNVRIPCGFHLPQEFSHRDRIIVDVRFSAGIDVHREKKVLTIDLHPVSGVVKKTDSSFVVQGFSELADRLIHSPLIGIDHRDDHETKGLQAVGHRTGVIDRVS